MVEKAENTEAQAAEQKDSPTLEAEIEAKLAALNLSVKDEETDTEESVEKKEDQTDDNQDEKAAADDTAPTLPTGLKRAALARGWSSDEIDAFHTSDPQRALSFFQDVYNAWNADNAAFSRRGRELIADAKRESETDDKEEETTPLNAKELAEKYGEKELLDVVIPRLEAQARRIEELETRLSGVTETTQHAREKELFAATQNFLTSEVMKPYQDFYGNDVQKLSKEQIENRMKLFQEADIIICGALDHGRELSVEEALERANAHLSADIREVQIRSQLRKGLEKRSKTLPPSRSKTSSQKNDGDISEDELIRRTEARLRKIRG